MPSTTTGAASQMYNPTSGSRCIPPTHASDLDVLIPGAAAVRETAKSLTAGLSDAQFNWKPAPDRWSIAQCIKHLILTGTMAANEQEAAIAKLEQQGKRSDGPYEYGGITAKMGNMLMSAIEPPVQRRFKTAKKVYPAVHHDREAVVSEFVGVYERLEHNLRRAKGLDLGAVSVGLPIPLFRIKLGQSMPFEIAHARRHLWQAGEVRRDPGFPPA